jgi:hypothetical protein
MSIRATLGFFFFRKQLPAAPLGADPDFRSPVAAACDWIEERAPVIAFQAGVNRNGGASEL